MSDVGGGKCTCGGGGVKGSAAAREVSGFEYELEDEDCLRIERGMADTSLKQKDIEVGWRLSMQARRMIEIERANGG